MYEECKHTHTPIPGFTPVLCNIVYPGLWNAVYFSLSVLISRLTTSSLVSLWQWTWDAAAGFVVLFVVHLCALFLCVSLQCTRREALTGGSIGSFLVQLKGNQSWDNILEQRLELQGGEESLQRFSVAGEKKGSLSKWPITHSRYDYRVFFFCNP